MAKKIRNQQIIIAAQFIHILIFIYTFHVFIEMFFGGESGLALLALWYTTPLYIVEFLIVIICKGNIYDILLPVATIFVLLSPVIFQTIFSSISSEFMKYSVICGAAAVISLNTILILWRFKKLVEA